MREAAPLAGGVDRQNIGDVVEWHNWREVGFAIEGQLFLKCGVHSIGSRGAKQEDVAIRRALATISDATLPQAPTL